MSEPLSILQDSIRNADGFVELRYHSKTSNGISVEKGKVERSQARRRDGVGVRVFDRGGWGFASTGTLDPAAISRAIDDARSAAKAAASVVKDGLKELPKVDLARGNFDQSGLEDILGRKLEEKVTLVTDLENRLRQSSNAVNSASCGYSEVVEHKAIVTTDGAAASFRLARPELRLQAIAERDGQLSTGFEAIGVTGDWQCLFSRASGEALAEKAARTATDLLSAGRPDGGRATVIMAPSIVGLLVHEAIGHTVEADFVQAGSVAAGKIGQTVASKLVTLCDSGASQYYDGAGGTIPVDDEGVIAAKTTIIDKGILTSYLHNRQSAAVFGVSPTGNARAWEYADQPLIRMRNTYMEPGTQSLQEIIESTEDGYLLDGPRNGQADSSGEFMFGVQEARRIKNGKIGELVRGVTISGIAFDVLATVDAISKEFRWDLGSGVCGKGQPAKVDAGGPYVRAQVLLAGDQ